MPSKFPIKRALLAAFIASILFSNLALYPAKSDDRLHAASSRFAFKLYDQIRKEPGDKNTFVSPTSVMLALAMTYNGADGTTRQGMARALEIEGMSLDEVNRAFAELKSALAQTDPKVQLKIANSLWLRDTFTLNPAFIERNKNYFNAELTSLNFRDPGAADRINAWVRKNTEGKIEKIVDKIGGDSVLLLINAIYFKGQWQFEFKKENTKPDVFRLSGGEQKKLPMMSQTGTYLYYKGKDFQSVALPYGKSGSVSMYVFLPDENISLDQFERNLTPENWDSWMKSFQMNPGDVMLPRFKVAFEAELNDELKAMGMAQAFDPNSANFSQLAKLTSGNLFISQVKHKAWGEVNEEGTVAAAVTSVTVGVTSVRPPQEKFVMKVDRPFFFAIRDNATGVLLFMGSITNPE